ncbi:MAG: 50S ribosomal protein L21 [Candidatus Omnitrophica bacterium]|nr:50S ribosomal protein L21 [Candidatus Omnitrophota bacterium]
MSEQYAVIESGSKQYRVEPNTLIRVEKIECLEDQKEIILDNVLFVRDGEKIQVGTPKVEGAQVICDLLGNIRGKKVISYRYRRRKDSMKKKGHRQSYTQLRVREIKAGK